MRASRFLASTRSTYYALQCDGALPKAYRAYVPSLDSRAVSPGEGKRPEPSAAKPLVAASKYSVVEEIDGRMGGLAAPAAPGPEDCCQSGCAVCIWDVYKEEFDKYKETYEKMALERKKIVAAELKKGPLPQDFPREGPPMAEMDENAGSMDASMKAFLAMEAAMK